MLVGVNGRPSGTPPGTPTGPRGTLKLGNYKSDPEFYGFLAHPFGFFLRHPPSAVSFISHFRVGRWLVLMATPPALPPEPHGSPRNGKIGKLRAESGILQADVSPFRFLSASPVRGGFVYLSSPRWAPGVDGRPFGTPLGPPRSPAERQNREITSRIRNFTDSWADLTVFSLRHPSAAVSFIYHFRVGCWALMGAPSERLPEPPTEPRGAPRNGKFGQLQIKSEILRIPGLPFRFSFCAARPRRFRLFRISALGVGWR